VGDTFARLKPALEPAAAAVAQFIDTAADTFVTFAETAAPLIQLTSYHLLVFAKAMDAINQPALLLTRTFNSLYRELGRLTGFSFGWDKERKADPSVREPFYSGAEELQRRMAKDALMASYGQKKPDDPIKGILEQMWDFIRHQLPEKIGEAVYVAYERAKKAAADSVNDNTPPGLLAQGIDGGARYVSEKERERDLDRAIKQARARKQGG
jgi:hypothetical protein